MVAARTVSVTQNYFQSMRHSRPSSPTPMASLIFSVTVILARMLRDDETVEQRIGIRGLRQLDAKTWPRYRSGKRTWPAYAQWASASRVAASMSNLSHSFGQVS